MPDPGLILLERDIACVVQLVLDMPMAADCGRGAVRRDWRIGDMICDLGTAAPQAGAGIAVQDIASDADHNLDHGLPLGSSNGACCSEYLRCPGLMPVAPFGDRSVAAGRLLRSAERDGLVQQGGLIVLQLDDELCFRLGGGLEGFFGSGWHRA